MDQTSRRYALACRFGWWTISDPIITFARFLKNEGAQCQVFGPTPLDFVVPPDETYETFHGCPTSFANSADQLSAQLADWLRPGDMAVFCDEDAFFCCAPSLHAKGVEVTYYSAEVTDSDTRSEFAESFTSTNAWLAIQDAGRHALFERVYGVEAPKAVLLPNVPLEQDDTPQGLPHDLAFLDNQQFVLLTGSLFPEHCVMETVESFVETNTDLHLLINGWGIELLDPLGKIAAANANIHLSTRHKHPWEMQQLYASCRAGIVAYVNEPETYKLCGLASGKMFWLCRYGKPLLCNDNESVMDIVQTNGLGLPFGETMRLQELETNYDQFSRQCRAFYEKHEALMKAELSRLFI